jgi:hypothetical protein
LNKQANAALELEFVVEPGKIEVMVGNSSADIHLTGEFEITGEVVCVMGERAFSSKAVVSPRFYPSSGNCFVFISHTTSLARRAAICWPAWLLVYGCCPSRRRSRTLESGRAAAVNPIAAIRPVPA